MSEFSRRVDVELFKDEPLTRAEFTAEHGTTGETLQLAYSHYLDTFRPYWWHVQSPNGEIITNGEHYVKPSGAINSIEVLFGDDTTMYYMPMFGVDRGYKLLRYGKTDRDHQAASQ
jgi:uncharacterized protein YegP (UPF0339 family)